jgi:hypothetical protein
MAVWINDRHPLWTVGRANQAGHDQEHQGILEQKAAHDRGGERLLDARSLPMASASGNRVRMTAMIGRSRLRLAMARGLGRGTRRSAPDIRE